jgi:hypothetical protein
MRFFLPLLLAAGTVLAAEPSSDLAAFTEQLQTALKQNNRSDDGYRSNVLAQFKQLESAIRRGDYERASQFLQNMNGYGGALPPNLQDEWADLADRLASQIEEARSAAAIKWKTEVDQLAKTTRDSCLKARSSDDLTESLVGLRSPPDAPPAAEQRAFRAREPAAAGHRSNSGAMVPLPRLAGKRRPGSRQ